MAASYPEHRISLNSLIEAKVNRLLPRLKKYFNEAISELEKTELSLINSLPDNRLYFKKNVDEEEFLVLYLKAKIVHGNNLVLEVTSFLTPEDYRTSEFKHLTLEPILIKNNNNQKIEKWFKRASYSKLIGGILGWLLILSSFLSQFTGCQNKNEVQPSNKEQMVFFDNK